MNVSIYTFGEFASGYDQFPNDYTTDLFKRFGKQLKAPTQLCIHREGNVVYYAYVRRLDGRRYIGICALLNQLMFTNTQSVFQCFEQMMSGLIARGELIMFDTQGNVTTNVQQLYLHSDTVEQLHEAIRQQLDRQPVAALPSGSFAHANNSVKEFVVGDSESDIADASTKYAYTYIYKERGYETSQTNSSREVIKRLNGEKKALQQSVDDLSTRLRAEKAKQRNTVWVSLLSVVVIIFGIILWTRVLFPSEVTHYETGEFVYYGPLKNNQPDGVGVAIYPKDDPDGRQYYVGRFSGGKRDDDAALLLYQNGNYYYGAMKDGQRTEGIDFNRTENCHYEGTFQNNQPYDGTLYDHKKVYVYTEGKAKYRE